MLLVTIDFVAVAFFRTLVYLYTCVKYTLLHLSDMLLTSMTIILKPVRYYGSRFTWSACSLSICISNNSSTMNMCLPEKQ